MLAASDFVKNGVDSFGPIALNVNAQGLKSSIVEARLNQDVSRGINSVSRSSLISIGWIAVLTCLLAGCRTTDPYCQTAIANLRAEKIQLENEYYALKSLYESDMARVGQPVNVPGLATPVVPTISDGEIIYEGGGYPPSSPEILPPPIGTPNTSPQNTPSDLSAPGQAPTLSNRLGPGTGAGLQANRRLSGSSVGSASMTNLASFIRNVEVNQLPAGERETTRLLVRPLDQQGAILPLTGAIKLRIYDANTGRTVYQNEFSSNQVSQWVSDQPGEQPGIHLSIPAASAPSLGQQLICDLQYRTADNRVLKKSTELVFAQAALPQQPAFGSSRGVVRSNATTTAPSGGQPLQRPGGRGTGATNASTSRPFQPESIGGDLEIEIGEELNFDTLPSEDVGRPKWRPDR